MKFIMEHVTVVRNNRKNGNVFIASSITEIVFLVFYSEFL